MGYIIFICSFLYIFFDLALGNQCEKKDETYNECPVYSCFKYLKTNDGEGNFVFHIKPFTMGKIIINLHKSYSHDTSTEILPNLFWIYINLTDINLWGKIKINKEKISNNNPMPYFRGDIIQYNLEVNGKDLRIPVQVTTAGDEIRVETSVRSSWSYPCDTNKSQPTPQPTQSVQPLPAKGDEGNQRTPTFPIRGWHVAITAAVILVLTLVVIYILRRKRRDHHLDLNQPTDQQSRLSQHL